VSFYVWAALLPRRPLRGCVSWAARDCVITGGSTSGHVNTSLCPFSRRSLARMRKHDGTTLGGCGSDGGIRKGVLYLRGKPVPKAFFFGVVQTPKTHAKLQHLQVLRGAPLCQSRIKTARHRCGVVSRDIQRQHAQRRGAPLRRRASPCLSTVDAAEHHSLPNITALGMQQRRDKQGRGCKRRTDHFIRARLQSGREFGERNFPEVRREVQ
jgi:hypothetical protein